MGGLRQNEAGHEGVRFPGGEVRTSALWVLPGLRSNRLPGLAKGQNARAPSLIRAQTLSPNARPAADWMTVKERTRRPL